MSAAAGNLKKVTVVVEDLATGEVATLEVPRCYGVDLDVDYESELPVGLWHGQFTCVPSRKIERILLGVQNPLPDPESGRVYRIGTR